MVSYLSEFCRNARIIEIWKINLSVQNSLMRGGENLPPAHVFFQSQDNSCPTLLVERRHEFVGRTILHYAIYFTRNVEGIKSYLMKNFHV
jgi:hypothetical protein